MRKLSLLLAILFLFETFSGCRSEADRSTDTPRKDTTEMSSQYDSSVRETEFFTETQVITETQTEVSSFHDMSEAVTTGAITETETELVTTETEPEFLQEPALPEKEPELVYLWNGGTEFSQYNHMTDDDFYAACAYYKAEGFDKYSSNQVGETYSATYIKENEYYLLYYNGAKKELTIGHDPERASLFPTAQEDYKRVSETSVTMQETGAINGMSFIIRLSDGSFILIDGGLGERAEQTYKKLIQLNGSRKNIRIRAWILSHSHGDHFRMFRRFANTYADKVTLERVLYCPVPAAYSQTREEEMYFINELPSNVALFEGAVLCPIYTGMVFQYADVKLEILLSNEQLYKHGDIGYFNDSSTVFRISNEGGSMLFLGDMGIRGCTWLMETYGDTLKSDMVQTSHHGVETAPFKIYEIIKPSTVFWPCQEDLFFSLRGEVHQPLLCADFVGEHILHGYGAATRALSYKPTTHYLDIMPTNATEISSGKDVENVRFEDGILKFDVVSTNDPKIWFATDGIDTEKYNALRIVVGADNCGETSQLFLTAGTEPSDGFTEAMSKSLKPQGISINGETLTLLVFLGNLDGYEGNLQSLRLDLGKYEGQTVEIHSIEAYWVEID